MAGRHSPVLEQAIGTEEWGLGPRTLHAWMAPIADLGALTRAGLKAHGGGAHQSKTMMFQELTALLASGNGEDPARAVLEDNLLAKPSVRARAASLYRLRQLYGIGQAAAICVALRRLWARDTESRRPLALLCALARDPLLRDSSGAVLDARLGERVRSPILAAAFEAHHPGRLGERMANSLARNVASSWTQAGFLRGAIRKERVRAPATPIAAAYAALLANLCGFGGMRLLESRWLDALDRPLEERLALLRQAEGLGLARVRSAGDVLEIEVRRPMAAALGVPALVHD